MGLLESYVALSPEVKETVEALRETVHDVHWLKFLITDIRDQPCPVIHVDAVGGIPKKRFDVMEESLKSQMNLFTERKHYDLGKLTQANYVLTKGKLVIEITYSPKPREHIDLDHYAATGKIIPRKLLDF